MRKNIVDKRIGFVALVMLLTGLVVYFVALFQAYGLVSQSRDRVIAIRSLQIIELVQAASKALILFSIVLAFFLLIKNLISKK